MAKPKGRTQTRKSKAGEDPDSGNTPGEDPGSADTPGRTQPGEIDRGGPKSGKSQGSVHTDDDPTADLVEGSERLLEESSQSAPRSSESSRGASKSAASEPMKSDKKSLVYKKKRTKPIRNQCTATSRRSGERCGLAATKGLDVCRFHGGGGQEMKAIGERRENKRKALEQANRMVQKDGVTMDPIDHLLDSLYRASQMVRVYGIMCAEIDQGADEQLSDDETRGELGYHVVSEEVTEGREIERFLVRSKDKLLTLNKHAEAQLHPFLLAYTDANKDRARIAKMCIDAGIAEMQMELVERQVDMAQEALEVTIIEMKLDKAARRQFVEAYARNLRDIGMGNGPGGTSPRPALSAKAGD